MPSLSPAAQAVLNAVASSMEGNWISPEFVPYEAHKIAAALRTAVNEMSREWGYYKHHDFLRDIAAELEGSND